MGTEDSLRSRPCGLTLWFGIAGSWRSYNRPSQSLRLGCNSDNRRPPLRLRQLRRLSLTSRGQERVCAFFSPTSRCPTSPSDQTNAAGVNWLTSVDANYRDRFTLGSGHWRAHSRCELSDQPQPLHARMPVLPTMMWSCIGNAERPGDIDDRLGHMNILPATASDREGWLCRRNHTRYQSFLQRIAPEKNAIGDVHWGR